MSEPTVSDPITRLNVALEGRYAGVPPSVEPLLMLDPEPSGVQRAVAF